MKKVSSKSVFLDLKWLVYSDNCLVHCMNKQHIPHIPTMTVLFGSWKTCKKMNRHIAGYGTMGDQESSYLNSWIVGSGELK